nr:piezo-type mechanosensitive ion channel homolog isoform X1 [Tanacetum cinerariifolium]
MISVAKSKQQPQHQHQFQPGNHSKGRTLLWFIVGFSVAVILVQVAFIFGTRLQTWRSPTVIYVLILQSLAAFIAFTELQEIRVGFFTWASSFLGRLAEAFDRIGSHVKVASFLLLPAIQLVAG